MFFRETSGPGIHVDVTASTPKSQGYSVATMATAGQSVSRVSANGQKKGSGPTSTTTAKATQPLNSPSKLEK